MNVFLYVYNSVTYIRFNLCSHGLEYTPKLVRASYPNWHVTRFACDIIVEVITPIGSAIIMPTFNLETNVKVSKILPGGSIESTH